MHLNTPLLALAMSFLLAAPALAQTTTEAPAAAPADTSTAAPTSDAEVAAAGISMGEEVDGVGTTYVKETHGDWQVNCVRSGLEADPCQLYQLLRDSEGNSVAEINMFNLPAGAQAVAGASIVTPLETLLTAQVTLRVDNAQAKRYPFTLCATVGCISRIGFTQAELNAFRNGKQATIIIVPAMLPDEQVEIGMSLNGITAAYAAVTAANDLADKAAAAAAPAQPSGN